MSARIKILVFDCDGVLFNSLQANIAYYNAILQHFKQSLIESADDERAAICHIGSSPQVFAALLGEDRVDAAEQVAQQIDYADFFPELIPEPYLYECLEELVEYLPLAVATNRRGSMHDIVTHFKLDKYFTHLVTSCDVARPKPYPDMLHRVADLGKCDTEELIYVGDSEYDRLAAQHAGAGFIAYKWEGGQKVTSHRELARLVKAHFLAGKN
ncbi:MAG: HAD-IA family hydrolase [Desulfuromonadaceae bacterium]|nr:HAD-IA family hydrolase [Desulfuromonadaceae bacterium]